MKHDMGGFYRLVRARLDEAGHQNVSYSLSIEWWNHRFLNAQPTAPAIQIYVAWGPGVGAHYNGPTFDIAFACLDADLPNHPAVTRPLPPAVPDVEVLAC